MSEPRVYYGDEWKHCDDGRPPAAPLNLRRRTRAEQQAHIDDAYGQGRMDVETWRAEYDRINLLRRDGSPIVRPAIA